MNKWQLLWVLIVFVGIGLGILLGNPNNPDKAYFICGDGTAPAFDAYTDTAIDAGSWDYICSVVDRTSGYMYIYKNGVQQSDIEDISEMGSCADGTNVFLIGVEDPDYGYREYWDGILDELRVSNAPRSSEWISASYNNQNYPSSFMSIGPEEPAP